MEGGEGTRGAQASRQVGKQASSKQQAGNDRVLGLEGHKQHSASAAGWSVASGLAGGLGGVLRS